MNESHNCNVNILCYDEKYCNVCGEEYSIPLGTCKCSDVSPTLAMVNLPWHKELRAQISRLSEDPDKQRKYLTKTLDQLVNTFL